MTLKELIESGLVKDDHIIKIVSPAIYATRKSVVSGNWYQDYILDLSDHPIWSAKFYSNTGTWVVTLEERNIDYADENGNFVQTV